VKAAAAASVLTWMAASVQAAPNPSEAALIESLIQAVAAAQDLVFIRNGIGGMAARPAAGAAREVEIARQGTR
jgi:hypothetical protein